MPRAVLECSVREQLLPEADLGLLQNRLYSVEAETKNLVLLLEQRERDCASLKRQLSDLQVSHSWRITAPLRALGQFFGLHLDDSFSAVIDAGLRQTSCSGILSSFIDLISGGQY